MDRFKVAIFGAGKVGSALAATLCLTGDIDVTIIDPSEEALDAFAALGLPVKALRQRPNEKMPAEARGSDLIVAAAPDWAASGIAELAGASHAHFLDFSPARPENLSLLQRLAETRLVLSGAGVAPGLVDNIASGLMEPGRTISDLTIRVGSLPRYPTNRLGYGQIWDIDAMIEEYTRACEAVQDGKAVFLKPLEHLEKVTLDGTVYECFTTARGLSDLTPYLEAGVRNVTFKTLRYPGHLDYMRFLLDDLGLKSRRDMLRSLLMNGLPVIDEDELLLFLTARSTHRNRPAERSLSLRFRSDRHQPFNAMTSVAAAYAASLIDLLRKGAFGASGMVAHNRIESEQLLENPFLKRLLVA